MSTKLTLKLNALHNTHPPLFGKLQLLRLPVLARPRSDSLGLDEPSRDRQEDPNPQMHAHSTLQLRSGQAFFAQSRTCAGTSFAQPLWQGRGLLLSFIPNQPPSRQVQFLSYALARLFDKTMQKRRKGRGYIAKLV